jgi:RNA polymerase sigma factor for flagellar operon FliA
MPVSPDLEEGAEDVDEAALWTQFKVGGSSDARERLFARHASFARNIARRHYRERSRGDIDFLDLQQLAYAGLLEAIDRFDLKKGAPFRHFAAYRVSGSILDGLSRMNEVREQISWHRRVRRERLSSLSAEDGEPLETSEAMAKLTEIAVGLALGFMLEGTGLFVDQSGDERVAASVPAVAYESAAWAETVGQLRKELDGLPERERAILTRHYMDGMNFDQLAELFGVTKGRVSQLHRAALNLLRKRLGARGHAKLGR